MTTQTLTHAAGSHLFRRILRGNAIFSGASGAILAVGASPIASLFGLSAPAVFVALGAGLLVYAAWLVQATARERVSRSFVLLIALLDTAWVLISVLGLLADWFPVTTEGKWIILFAADAVSLFAALEFVSLWRTRNAHPG